LVQIEDEAMLIVNIKLKQLMKELATYMVPVVQKVYLVNIIKITHVPRGVNAYYQPENLFQFKGCKYALIS
jgi:hypothetical protein